MIWTTRFIGGCRHDVVEEWLVRYPNPRLDVPVPQPLRAWTPKPTMVIDEIPTQAYELAIRDPVGAFLLYVYTERH